MDAKELNLKLLALAKLLDEVQVRGYENLAKVATVINELRNIAKLLTDEQSE